MSDEGTHLSTGWYALAVRPRFDKAVARTLQSKGYETVLPLYRKRLQEGARLRESELPLFPGYVCCRFDVRDRLPILTTPGVDRIFGPGNIPVPLSDVEVASLQAVIRAGLPLQPFPFVEAGQRVRIEGGALNGVEGIVMSLKETLRLVLSLTPLQRSVLLEVARDQVTLSSCAGAAPLRMAQGDVE